MKLHISNKKEPIKDYSNIQLYPNENFWLRITNECSKEEADEIFLNEVISEFHKNAFRQAFLSFDKFLKPGGKIKITDYDAFMLFDYAIKNEIDSDKIISLATQKKWLYNLEFIKVAISDLNYTITGIVYNKADMTFTINGVKN